MSSFAPHPFAEVFPPLSPEELKALTLDIRAHGQREPATLYQQKLLDGLSRAAACAKLKRPLKTRTFKGTEAEAIAFVISINVRRRHLTESQRAMIAAKLATLTQGRPKTGSAPGLTQRAAAKAFGVHERTVRGAAYVQKHGAPSEIRAVERGDVSLAVIEKALRAGGRADQGRERDARQFQQYVRRLPEAASAFVEVARRVQRLAGELGLELSAVLDAPAKQALRDAVKAAGDVLGG